MNTVSGYLREKHRSGNGARASCFDIQAILIIAYLLMQNYHNHARVCLFFFVLFLFFFLQFFCITILLHQTEVKDNWDKGSGADYLERFRI